MTKDPLPPTEIPLFRVMTATVTFQNANGCSEAAPYVSLKADHTSMGAWSEPIPAPSAGREGGVRRRGRESVRQDEQSPDIPLVTMERYFIMLITNWTCLTLCWVFKLHLRGEGGVCSV